MAQHDYVISNQGFASYRSDHNSSLSAIVSNNSGATEPSTTYAYQWWYDTTTDILKMRNADNDAWITMFTFNQTTDTYSLATDVELTITENLDLTGSATISGDLTVDTDTLYVDSTNNEVGIGTTSPSQTLDVQGNAFIGGVVSIESPSNSPLQVESTDAFCAMTLADTGGSVKIETSGGVIKFETGGDASTAGTNATEIARFTTEGLAIGGTGSANTLDDYEEGTFTPAIIGTTTAGSGTYSKQSGDYTKIGQLVRVAVHLRWSAHTGTGNMEIGELPFTSGLGGLNYFIPSFFTYNITLGAGKVVTGFTPGSSTRIRIQAIATGGGTTANVGMDPSGEIYATLVYRV